MSPVHDDTGGWHWKAFGVSLLLQRIFPTLDAYNKIMASISLTLSVFLAVVAALGVLHRWIYGGPHGHGLMTRVGRFLELAGRAWERAREPAL